jgi:hypothetical protein
MILVFGGVGSLLAVVVVLGMFGAIDGRNKAGEEHTPRRRIGRGSDRSRTR